VIGSQMVKAREAQALVTAGSTGAFMAAGLMIIGRLPIVERPALAPIIPTRDGRGAIILDVGANMDAKPEHLLQYSIMGAIYAEKILGRQNPRVALLNVGAEEGKGNVVTKEAYSLLAKAGINFVGNLEAREVMDGGVDVIVCDGFTGNVLIKFMEGMAATIFDMLKEQFVADLPSKIGAYLLKPSLRRLKSSLDYSDYGGAPLLGIDGICVKCHGSSNRKAIMNGLFQAQGFIENRVVDVVATSLAKIKEQNTM
ncbi:MAG: phosphate acyltransferase PlsX, partial [bacterium]|nr:phosphate acyltransferase PlsX [bacterium]